MSASDASVCEHMTRQHARTFALASYFLPPRKRRAAFAVYAFCRTADDIVDAATPPLGTPNHSGPRLDAHRRRLDAALAGRPDSPMFRELAWTVREFGVPGSVLHGLVDGVARDLAPHRYTTWAELETYCHGVASTVGVMCAHVFGIAGDDAHREQALADARTLGVAMQLTNILRDVGDDARAGRCYLPADDLTRFAIDPAEISANARLTEDTRWRHFMAFEISRARHLYASAMHGIPLLASDARRCAAACAIGYAGILDAIERIGYDSIRHRARLGPLRKLGVFLTAWRFPVGHTPGTEGISATPVARP